MFEKEKKRKEEEERKKMKKRDEDRKMEQRKKKGFSSDENQGQARRSLMHSGDRVRFGLKIFRDRFSKMSWGQNSNAWKIATCVLLVMLCPGTGRRESHGFQPQACYGNTNHGSGWGGDKFSDWGGICKCLNVMKTSMYMKSYIYIHFKTHNFICY